MSFHFFTSVSFFTPLLLPNLSEGILPDEVYNVHSQPRFGNASTRSKEFSCASGTYAEKQESCKPFRGFFPFFDESLTSTNFESHRYFHPLCPAKPPEN